MSKAFFLGRNASIILLILFYLSVTPTEAAEGKSIVITSKMLTADNKNNTAVFEGSVVAKSEDIIIYSDRMEVVYNKSRREIAKIHAYGNVKVHKNKQTIFSEEAIYLGKEGKIIFTGAPKAVEGENMISGTEIIYFLKDGRAIIKGSSMVLKKKEE